MRSAFHADCTGAIQGLRLPYNAWVVLNRENITTIEQFKAFADKMMGFNGIGPKTARAIRAELTRAASPDSGL